MTTAVPSQTDLQRELAQGKRRRQRNETILALLFVLPATLITFMFRIWPVIFGFYVSLHQWRARTHNFLGLDQYVRALGSAAYVLAFFLVILFLYGGYTALRKAQVEMAEGKGSFWPYLVPGFILALGTIVFAIGFAAQTSSLTLPGLGLLILGGGAYWYVTQRYFGQVMHNRHGLYAWQLWALWLLAVGLFIFTVAEIRSGLAIAFDLAAVLAPDLPLPSLDSQLIAAGVLVLAFIGVYLVRRWRDYLSKNFDYDQRLALAGWLRTILIVAIVVCFTYLIAAFQYNTAVAEAVRVFERGEVGEVGQTLTGLERNEFRQAYGSLDGEALADMLVAWPQVVSIGLGFFLMVVAYRMWRGAAKTETALGMWGLILLAIIIAIAGWLLIGGLPEAMGVGDTDYYRALMITASYSLGTVPIQLSLGLFMSYLLFYEVGIGKAAYRMIYFLPYVAPTVATATVFGIIFSSRSYALANQILGAFGIPAQAWLHESKGIFEIGAELIFGPDVVVPGFLVGPSLALISIIIYNIWVFAGYNAVIFLAGLGAIPGELFEAAKVDGAGRWKAFRHIIFPLLSPTTFFLLVLSITGTFRAFSHIYVMRQPAARGTADTASVHIFIQFWQFNQWGYASAMAFILFGIILILTLVQNEASKGRVFYG